MQFLDINGVKRFKRYTETYVDNAIEDLIGTAPDALDTLGEIADALNNDANLASTLTTQIAAKYTKPSTGIPSSDLASSVTTSLSKADTALQSETDPVFSASTAASITANDVTNWNSKQDAISDLATIRSNASAGAAKVSNVQSDWNATSGLAQILNKPTIPAAQVQSDWNATSGMGVILNKPTIPAAVTESTVAGWGFTKNAGTYSKPSGGIPATDLTSAVQTSLEKADTALQSYTESDPVYSASAAASITSSDITNWNNKTSNTGTITGITMNGTNKGTSGVVDLGTVLTSYTETDPTVPAWAKAANKPTYTAAEVGALPDTTVIPTVPTISTNVASDKTSDTKASSPKSVYEEIHPSVATAQPAGGFAPNILYNLGTLTGSKTFTLASPSDNTIVNHYYWTFTAGSTAPTITWPSGISWFGGSAPAIVAGKHYDVSILDNIAVCMEV